MDPTEQLEALWAEVYGGPPSIRVEPPVLAAVLVGSLPLAPAYTPAPSGDASQGSTKPSEADTAAGRSDQELP